MRQILGITHELSQVLQSKDQCIINAMNLVNVSKGRLQTMRDDGWEILLSKVFEFCSKHDICVLQMEDEDVARGRIRRRTEKKNDKSSQLLSWIVLLCDWYESSRVKSMFWQSKYIIVFIHEPFQS